MRQFPGVSSGVWCNALRLDTLFASHDERGLAFFVNSKDGSGKNERANVILDDGKIPGIASVQFLSANSGEVNIPADKAKRVVVGERNWQREVYHFLMPGGPASTMRLGITHHLGDGTWSSLPHDFELNVEPGFEEVFFHILSGGLGGRKPVAWQRGRGIWFDRVRVDEMWPVTNHTFSTIPMGYHPVVGEPGVRVSYVWCYLAKHPRWEKI